MVALALFVLMGFVALGIDVGYMYTIRHELQRCADAGALAGASVFRETGRDSTDGPTWDCAVGRAGDYATRDEVVSSPLTLPEVSVTKGDTPWRIRVDTQRTVPLFFARVLGWDNNLIKAFAVAEAYGVCKKVRCIVPWGIPAPYTDTNGDNTFTAGIDDMHWDSSNANGGPPTTDDCDKLNSATIWDNHTISGTRSNRDETLCQGSLQTLKIGIPGSQENPGNFLALDLSGAIGPGGCPGVDISPGANFYYWMIEHSCDCDLKADTATEIPLDTKPGEMVKRTITAVAPTNYYTDPYYTDPVRPYLPQAWKNDPSVPDSLMNQDSASQWIISADLPGGVPSTGINSGRIVRIPIYDPGLDFTGRTTITPMAFVGFWIQDVVYKTETIDGKSKDVGTVVGRFISLPGEGTYEEECGSTVRNIRLVE